MEEKLIYERKRVNFCAQDKTKDLKVQASRNRPPVAHRNLQQKLRKHIKTPIRINVQSTQILVTATLRMMK